MPTALNTQKVIAKVRAELAKAGKSDELKAQLAGDAVTFVASRCVQLVDEAETLEAAHQAITAEFSL